MAGLGRAGEVGSWSPWQWTAPTDPAPFNARLARRFGGPNPYVSWLEAAWRADWGRWCIYQITPPRAVPSLVWGDRQRIVVRRTPQGMRVTPDARYRLDLSRDAMTRTAWAIYQRTGGYPQPFWVVQGAHGGHKWQWTFEERKLLEIAGLPGDPPAPRALPYAPLDARVLRKLAALDQLPRWRHAARSYWERDERALDAEEQAMMEQHRWALWRWLETQVAATVEAMPTGRLAGPGFARRAPPMDEEQIQEQFITSAY